MVSLPMRALRFAPMLLACVPVAASCSSDKYPDGDIGYGPCAPTNGASSNGGSGGKSNASGGTSSQAGKGNAPGKAGSDSVPEGGSDAMPPGDECEQAWSEPPDTSECDLDALEDSGQTIGEPDASGIFRVVSKDTTLPGGKTYKLDSNTVILPGATLTIEKCTKILGQSETSLLIASSGLRDDDGVFVVGSEKPGRLVAVGEKNAPIIFTSRKPPGQRTRKDWGGVVLAGKAQTNEGANGTTLVVEATQGVTMAYGWNTAQYNQEDSGDLRYVRIEYAGYDTGGSIETNGLTLAGVGSGTTISHIMVANAIDDCFEWFGGTVNADHLIAFNCDDDSFDTDYGFVGTTQFAFARQFPLSDETDSNGFESDGNQRSPTREPFASNRFSNVTLCGGNYMQTLVNPRYGAVFRQGTHQTINNALITGFDSAAFAVRQTSTIPIVTNSSAFENYDLFDPADANNLKDEAWFLGMDGNSLDRPAGLCNCYANPPLPFPKEEISGGAPGDGYPEPDAAYRGAFKDSKPESNWMTGLWVDWSEK
jgi:hypothetical protein